MTKGRPKSQPFMKLGKVSVSKLDALNWTVETPERQTFHATLPSAIKRAVAAAADSKATDAVEWLAEYDRITRRLTEVIAKSTRQLTQENL